MLKPEHRDQPNTAINTKTEAMISTGQDEVKTAMMAGQEKMEATINSTPEFEHIINNRVEGVLTSVDQRN
jgi:hypothetical protein